MARVGIRDRLCWRSGPSLRTSTLRNGRRSSAGEPASLLAREKRGLGSGACCTLAPCGCRSALRRSFQGALLTARTDAGSGSGARTALGRPRGRFGVGATTSAAASCLRGRPGLRRAGMASVSVSVSGASGAGESITAAWSSRGAGRLVVAAGRNSRGQRCGAEPAAARGRPFPDHHRPGEPGGGEERTARDGCRRARGHDR